MASQLCIVKLIITVDLQRLVSPIYILCEPTEDKLFKLKIMKIEYYDSIDFGMLAPFREKMQERIFCKKRNDGQKGQKTHGQLGKEMQKLTSDFQQKLNEFIDNAEKCNIHPEKLANIHPLMSFYSFSSLNTTKGYMTLFEDTDEPLQVVSNEGEYFEQSFLDELIKKWFESNGKEYPKNNAETEFFYDYNWSFILGIKRNCFNNDIEKIKNYEAFMFKARIYTFKNNMKSYTQNFPLFVENFIADSELYKKQINELIEESIYSDRGNIIVDPNHPAFIYKLNGQDIYQFTSIHFWEIYDEFILLQTNQPDLFGKGAESILRELYRVFSSKNKIYWGTFEEFKLKIQQQYLYTANHEKGLRLDLFRNILTDGDFEGGIWHGFKHFKLNDNTLSAKSGGGKNYEENHFFSMLKEAFFVKTWKIDNKGRINVSIPYSTTEGNYTFGFHEDKCLDNDNNVVSTLYSLSTAKYKSR
ncbi:MAG: hypothetical protein MUF58_15860 [Arcicella sp.]|jgi:hypothetical protein|nr:hypothetical protein [Arcicella sp.]